MHLSFYTRAYENQKNMQGKKYGGRKPGSQNKVTITVRGILSNAMDEYYNSEKFKKDLENLKPKDRLDVMEKLASYVLPKLQSTSLDMLVETKKTIEDRLLELSEDIEEE